MAKNELYLYFNEHLVGALDEDVFGKLGLTYATQWLGSPDAFQISLSLPLRAQRYEAEKAHPFFSNLLPEGLVRQRICQELKISPSNDSALLRAIGGDCAGALSITDDQANPRDDHYEKLDHTQLEQWARGSTHVFSAISGKGRVRLSLAGAQDKLPVKVDDEGIWLPIGNSPSTHLLKFHSTNFKHLPANETCSALLAASFGLPAVSIELHPTDTQPIAVIKRYDRHTVNGTTERLHQEDACQALGILPMHKYEKEGGPSFVQCINLVRKHCANPAKEIQSLIKWAIFNVLIGNSDAHGKNLSFLFTKHAGVVLAPFYDLVSTREYPRLDTSLAMAIGDEFNPDSLTSGKWKGFAAKLGIQVRTVSKAVSEMVDTAPAAVENTVSVFQKSYGDSPVIHLLSRNVMRRAKRLGKLLAQ